MRASGAKRVLDLGCGEGRLLRELMKEKQFEEIVGMDVSIREENAVAALEIMSRFAEFTSVSSACSPWRASRSIRGCEQAAVPSERSHRPL